jgi:hypothetical protein
MSTPNVPRGPGLFEINRGNGDREVTSIRRLAGAERIPGSVLIGWAAWLLVLIGAGALYVSFSAQRQYVFGARHQDAASIIEALLLDVLMIVFTLLALGLSRAGKSSRTERALILVCAAASAYMNMSAADTASPRSVVAYAVAPIALAVVVDRVVAVIRRHVLGDDEDSAWTALGRALLIAGRLAGLAALYGLRFVLAPRPTATGLRRMVLDAAPLPTAAEIQAPIAGSGRCQVRVGLDRYGELVPCLNAIPCADHPDGKGPVPLAPFPAVKPPPTKKAALLALYRVHPDYGNRAAAAKVAAELAPQVELSPGTARSYLYAELPREAS